MPVAGEPCVGWVERSEPHQWEAHPIAALVGVEGQESRQAVQEEWRPLRTNEVSVGIVFKNKPEILRSAVQGIDR